MSPKISIILCTYNEVNYIQKTVLELEKHIKNLELIIVDDNSTDGTKKIINELNHNKKFKIIFRNKSKGLASAFLRGLIETTGDFVGWLDTNMDELVPKFSEMSNKLNANNDIVLLSRYVDGGQDLRKNLRALSSKYFNLLCGIILRQPIKDFTSGIFLMKRKVIDEVTFLGYGHGEFFIEFLHNSYKKGFKILEIPFTQSKDDDLGMSKSAPNIFKFFLLGLIYFIRIFSTIIRRG